MARRSESFDEFVSEQMQDIEFAKEFLLSGMTNFSDSVEDALKSTIEKMGIKEFSELAEVDIQNVSAFIKGRRKVSKKVLDHYLSVFGLKTKLIIVEAEEVA